MSIWTCPNCQHNYVSELGDPKHGVIAGTTWDNLPDDWVCPECGAPKFEFTETESSGREGSGWTAD